VSGSFIKISHSVHPRGPSPILNYSVSSCGQIRKVRSGQKLSLLRPKRFETFTFVQCALGHIMLLFIREGIEPTSHCNLFLKVGGCLASSRSTHSTASRSRSNYPGVWNTGAGKYLEMHQGYYCQHRSFSFDGHQ